MKGHILSCTSYWACVEMKKHRQEISSRVKKMKNEGSGSVAGSIIRSFSGTITVPKIYCVDMDVVYENAFTLRYIVRFQCEKCVNECLELLKDQIMCKTEDGHFIYCMVHYDSMVHEVLELISGFTEEVVMINS